MLSRLRYWLTNPRTLFFVAIAVVAGLFLLGSDGIKLVAFWLGVTLLCALLVVVGAWLIRRRRARRSSGKLGEALAQPGSANNDDIDTLRNGLRDAIRSIKTSRLGQTKGKQALYELPWYMVLGNPAAGKSTAIVNSGLHFPLADQHGKIVHGVGGTRHCDWYFTSNGILLDTAGRYSVEEENHDEWLGFLKLLRRHRPRAPINGIIIATSIAELTSNSSEFAIDLAKNLRQRVQELTEQLGVVAPVYVVFTKADLISGFSEFFSSMDESETARAWGATLPFDPQGTADVAARFDRFFDELCEGLREMSRVRMSAQRDGRLGPGLLTLPLEFHAMKGTLQTFISTLFEDNPYQHKPVFRGFYFTSAAQESTTVHKASKDIAQTFHLAPARDTPTTVETDGGTSYFLHQLFRKVIFADKGLVRQYSSKARKRRRRVMLVASVLVVVTALGSWLWSWSSNRQLVQTAQADLARVAAMQKGQVDLQSRLQALHILQNRLEQLRAYRAKHPVMVDLGLYQGRPMTKKIREEYFHGMRQVMLAPVTQNMEAYLLDVVTNRAHLTRSESNAAGTAPTAPGAIYQPPSATNSEDAYNALRAYLMLARPQRVEPVQLSDQLTRFWQPWLNANKGLMSRGELINLTRELLTFYIAQFKAADWPTINDKTALVSDSRATLRNVMRGMSAIRRVYAQIKARATTRFPTLTVASITGSKQDDKALLTGHYAVPGVFTKEAWQGYVKDAIKQAANSELTTRDWVLQTSRSTDLTVSGNPKQLQNQLLKLYDEDYIAHWQRFLQGIRLQAFDDFEATVQAINVLGDPHGSPLHTLLQTAYRETTWDNPAPVDQSKTKAAHGVVAWFKRVILRRTPGSVNVNADDIHLIGHSNDPTAKTGPIGGSFTALTALVAQRGDNSSLLDAYLRMLDQLRSQLAAINIHDDPGPGARRLIENTLNNSDSELASGLQLVEQQILNGLDDNQRTMLRPLLLQPLLQTFQALVAPAEDDINTIWKAQVYQPFQKTLADKYPFNRDGDTQAANDDIARIFGPSGEIANFATNVLGSLVNQRGNTLSTRHWAGMGITLSPTLQRNFPQWVTPAGQTAADDDKTIFQIRPEPARGVADYSININGQTLHYQNTPPTWQTFVWNGAQAAAVAKVTANTVDGRSLVVEDFSGPDALTQLFMAANGGRDNGVYTLTWHTGDKAVTVKLRIISGADSSTDDAHKNGLLGTSLPLQVAGDDDDADKSGDT